MLDINTNDNQSTNGHENAPEIINNMYLGTVLSIVVIMGLAKRHVTLWSSCRTWPVSKANLVNGSRGHQTAVQSDGEGWMTS